MLSILYAIFYIILGHAYMMTETARQPLRARASPRSRAHHPAPQPSFKVMSSLSGYNSTLIQRQLWSDVNSVGAPAYCNMSTGPSWVDAPGQAWQNPQCAGYMQRSEFSSTGVDGSVTVNTNYLQKGYARTCNFTCSQYLTPVCPSTSSNITLMGPEFPLGVGENASAPLYLIPSACTTAVTSYADVYVYLAENVSITFTPYYSTSWGDNGLYDDLTLVDSKGKQIGEVSYGGTFTFATLSVALTAAGVSLDAQNENLLLTSGEAPNVSTTTTSTDMAAVVWPTYRLTGMVLSVDVQTSNYRSTNPINFNVSGRIVVSLASAGMWHTSGSTQHYFGLQPTQEGVAGGPAYDTQWLERQWQGVQLQFGVTGVMGHPSAFAALSSILSAFLIVMLAVAITDGIGNAISEEFQHEKYEDDGQRQAFDAFLEKEADHGVPFNFEDLRLRGADGELSEECYESAIFRLEKELDELRRGGEKVRDAAAMIAEELDLPLLTDKGQKAEAVCKLVPGETVYSAADPDGTFVPFPANKENPVADIIFLYPGENVVGRGIGLVKSPTVSRKQVCIRVDADSPDRAFVVSMRKESAPSYPVIKKGGSTGPQAQWKRISNKGQSLKFGDVVGLEQKLGAIGTPMKAKCEYQLCPLHTVVEVEKPWYSTLFGG